MKKKLCFVIKLSCLFLPAAIVCGGENWSAISSTELGEISKDITTIIVSKDVNMNHHQMITTQERSNDFFVTASGSGADAYSVQQTTDGGYIVAGIISGNGSGWDVLLLKYDASGTLIWARTAGGSANEFAYSVQQTTDGGYILAGWTDSYGAGNRDVLLLKYDVSGTLTWARTAGGSEIDEAHSVQQTTDEGYVVAGYTYNYGVSSYDVLLLRYDASGTLTWARTAGGSGIDIAYSVQQTTDGGYVVAGSTDSYGVGNRDVLLLKYDAAGTLTWTRTAGGSGGDEAYSVQQTTDGGYIVTGYTESDTAGNLDVLLLKFDASGTLTWAKTAGGNGVDIAYAVQQITDGGYIVAGYTESYRAGNPDVLLLKYDASGILTWARTAGGREIDEAYSVQQTTDGGYILAGTTFSYGVHRSAFLLKFNVDGFIGNCPAITSCNPETNSPAVATSIPPLATSIPSLTTSSPSLSISAPVVITMVVCPESTPAATLTPATPTAVTTVTGSPTPPPDLHCHIAISLNQDYFLPDDNFNLSVIITPYANQLTDLFFVVLDVWGSYFFYPSWTEQLAYESLKWPAQPLPSTILDFTWPPGAGSASGLGFYTAVLDENFNLVSNLTNVMFSYGE